MQELFKTPQFNTICEQNNIIYLGLFGSHARGEETPSSDLDLLVQYNQPVGYLTHAKVQNTFEDYFGRPVDLVFRNSIKPHLKPYIMKDLKTVYEKR